MSFPCLEISKQGASARIASKHGLPQLRQAIRCVLHCSIVPIFGRLSGLNTGLPPPPCPIRRTGLGVRVVRCETGRERVPPSSVKLPL